MSSVLSPLSKSTDATVGTNDVRDEIKTFYKKGLIKYAEKRTVFSEFGQSATIPRNQGKTYEWRRALQLTRVTGAAVALSEGVTPTGSTLSFERVTASPAAYGDYYAGTDWIDVTIYDPLRTIVVDAQAYQMAQVIDNLIQTGVLAGSTNHQFAATGGTSTSRVTVGATDVLNELELRKARRTLVRQAAKPLRNGKFVAIIHPDTTFTLFSDTNIRQALVSADLQKGSSNAGSLFTGQIGDYMGITFVESELAPVATAAGEAGINVYLTVVMAADYFGKVDISGLTTDSIFKELGSGGTEDPLNQRWTQGWKTTHASQILNQLNAVVIEHAVA